MGSTTTPSNGTTDGTPRGRVRAASPDVVPTLTYAATRTTATRTIDDVTPSSSTSNKRRRISTSPIPSPIASGYMATEPPDDFDNSWTDKETLDSHRRISPYFLISYCMQHCPRLLPCRNSLILILPRMLTMANSIKRPRLISRRGNRGL
jgi:hypothetical protein